MSEEIYVPNVATLCYLIDKENNKVLLGRKKYGGAKGKLNGFGGKVETRDASIKDAAIREFFEETGVTLNDLEISSIVRFHERDKAEEVTVTVYAYTTSSWSGVPTESNEMTVEWVDMNNVPFNEMWENDRLWFNIVISGKKTEIDLYTTDGKSTEFKVAFKDTLEI